MEYFYKCWRFKWWIISSVQTISNTKKVYGVDVQSATVFPENGKLWNLHFRPKFSKSWIHQIANIKYWIINDLTNNISVIVWYKRKFEITVAFLRRRPSSFWKQSKKKVVKFYTEKATTVRISNQGHQISVWKCSFQMFEKKWLIYHMKKELNDFGLKIRIFDI